MSRWIDEAEYEEYLSTYAKGSVNDCWRAVFKMTALFSKIAKSVAEELGYSYNSKEEIACMEFLNIVYTLPKDAKEII